MLNENFDDNSMSELTLEAHSVYLLDFSWAWSSVEVTNGDHLFVAFEGFKNLHELACSATGRYGLLRKHPIASGICLFAMSSWATDLTLFVTYIGMQSLNFVEMS